MLGLAITLAAVVAAVDIVVSATVQSAPQISQRSFNRYWFLTPSAFYQLHVMDPSLDTMFSGPNAYMRADHPAIRKFWHGKIFAEYKEYAAFFRDVRQGLVDPAASVAMYDPERWKATSVIETRDPVTYARMFAVLAHQHGWLAMMTPSCRLLTRMPGWRGGSVFDVFDACGAGIEAAIAPYADILDLQAQSMETDTATYVRHILDWTTQARAANPRIKILAQLSTSPTHRASPDDLLRAARAVDQHVDGYWIDIASRQPASVADAVTFFRGFRASIR
jgi:hypothetical protein